MTSSSPTNIGIDVCQDKLDVAVYETNEHFVVCYELAECVDLIERLQRLNPARIVIEASGGVEHFLVSLLAAARLPVIVVNPRQIRDFARATGKLAKTDRLDAFAQARFAAMVEPEVRPLKPKETQALDALLTRRHQLVEMTVAERQRMSQAQQQRRLEVAQDIEAHLAWLKERLAKCEAELACAIRQSPVWREREQLLRSAPGVGRITALTLIADLPELGQLEHKQITALCGLAPHPNDSGKSHGRRSTHGGRSRVRATLYMATLTAIRNNENIQTFYQRLLANGKTKQLALTACMRKLLVILNAMVKSNSPWRSDTNPQIS